MRTLTLVTSVASLLLSASVAPASSEPGAFERFHGVWVGQGVTTTSRPGGAGPARRDVDVVIRETEAGLEMTWRTLVRHAPDRITARFVAARAPGTFDAYDVTPALTVGDALWARLEGERLVVYLSGVGDDGSARVARYACSVSARSMTFEYTLSREGEVLESVTGDLSRAKVLL